MADLSNISPWLERRIKNQTKGPAFQRDYEFDQQYKRWRVTTGESLKFTNCPDCMRRADVEEKLTLSCFNTLTTRDVFPIRCRNSNCRSVLFLDEPAVPFNQELVPKKEVVNV